MSPTSWWREVLEADPPRGRPTVSPGPPTSVAEGFTKVIWETQDEGEGITRLTVTHELRCPLPRRAGDEPVVPCSTRGRQRPGAGSSAT